MKIQKNFIKIECFSRKGSLFDVLILISFCLNNKLIGKKYRSV